jgi:GMP synthase-like glutamine amidotransferase
MSRPLRILAFQHHPTSPAGLVAEQAAARGALVQAVEAEHGAAIPADALAHDGLLLLGGAMCALDDAAGPHFPALLDLARAFAAAGRPVLGICLGGQLLARAFGGAVLPGRQSEFGFVDLDPLPGAADDRLLQGEAWPVPVMQWHDDSFVPPPTAVPLLASAGCAAQGFRLGQAVWGFQGHFEVTASDLGVWGRLRAELTGEPGVARRLASDAAQSFGAAEAFGRRVAARWLDACARPAP